MIFNAYARRDGALILVPECLVAPREAERRHGPLAFVGRIDPDTRGYVAIWHRVLMDLDRQSYAVVRSSERALLMPAPVELPRPA